MALSASLKSSSVTCIFSRISVGIGLSRSISGRYLLRAFIADSLERAARSAPTKPYVMPAISSRKSFFLSSSIPRGIPLVCMERISFLPFLSGTPMLISLSNLPGLLRAGSTASILFVAPITMTCPLSLSPSIRVRSWATTLLSTSPWTSSLLGAMESISSMNMIEGSVSSALRNISLSFCSLWP